MIIMILIIVVKVRFRTMVGVNTCFFVVVVFVVVVLFCFFLLFCLFVCFLCVLDNSFAYFLVVPCASSFQLVLTDSVV